MILRNNSFYEINCWSLSGSRSWDWSESMNESWFISSFCPSSWFGDGGYQSQSKNWSWGI